MPLRVVTCGEHRNDCRAQSAVRKGRWDNPWSVYGTVEWRDVQGKYRGRTTAWLRLPCNDPDCSAHVLVEQDSLLQLVEESTGAIRA